MSINNSTIKFFIQNYWSPKIKQNNISLHKYKPTKEEKVKRSVNHNIPSSNFKSSFSPGVKFKSIHKTLFPLPPPDFFIVTGAGAKLRLPPPPLCFRM